MGTLDQVGFPYTRLRLNSISEIKGFRVERLVVSLRASDFPLSFWTFGRRCHRGRRDRLGWITLMRQSVLSSATRSSNVEAYGEAYHSDYNSNSDSEL